MLWLCFYSGVCSDYGQLGVGLAVITGYIIGKLHLEKWVEDFVFKAGVNTSDDLETTPKMTMQERLQTAQYQSVEILKSVWLYIVIGIAIGAGINGYVPTDLITKWAGRDNPIAVIIAVLLGVPLYTNIRGVLPVAEALVKKGMPLGTVLSFAMAVTALSLPQMIILRRVLKPQLLFLFITITTIGIIAVGYLFNFLL